VKISHHIDFLVALLIVVVAAVFSFLTYNHTLGLSFLVGPLRFSHWLSIIGTIGIAVATPLFTIIKRSFLTYYTRITRFHIFGNLIFFGLVALHFSAQMGRSATSFPELGTGLAMFIAMGLQIMLGFTQRFRSQRNLYKKVVNPRTNQFLHASLVMVFYAVILFHVLHGFSII
jgi:hypothetical protein